MPLRHEKSGRQPRRFRTVMHYDRGRGRWTVTPPASWPPCSPAPRAEPMTVRVVPGGGKRPLSCAPGASAGVGRRSEGAPGRRSGHVRRRLGCNNSVVEAACG